MFFFKGIFKQLVIASVIGFVIRKLMASDNPRAKQAGQSANRVVGGAVGLDETGHKAKRGRRVTKSAGTAVVGGALGYFFDRRQGRERRERAKSFLSEQLAKRRNGSVSSLPAPELPAGAYAPASS
jgi:hypothetical protein